MNNEENNVNDTNTPLPSIKVDQPPADGEQANDESAPIEIPQVESYTLESIPDELRITNYQDDMTSDSDSLLITIITLVILLFRMMNMQLLLKSN